MMKAVFRGARGVLLMLSLLMVNGAVGNAADTASINEEALRRSIGQMIVVGFYGINNTDAGFHHVMEDLERGLIGGVLFLARNVQSKLDLETMVREVRQCNCSFTPLIAVDEEGGIIERLGERYGFRHTPSPADIGRSSEENARSEYERLAQKLSYGLDTGLYVNSAILEGVTSGEIKRSSVEKSEQRIKSFKYSLRNNLSPEQSPTRVRK
jgi:hypothetical protein